MLLEIIKLLLQTFWTFLSELFIALIGCIPVFVELKQTFSHCTPVGMWALFLGVPPVVIIVALKIAKALKTQN